MLSYNDALAHNQPAEVECVVCKSLVDAPNIIWHSIKFGPDDIYPNAELVVPICLDCADLFHDVKPTKPTSGGSN